MKINLKNMRTLNNIMYAFSAQAISLLVSVIMSLIASKILGINEFSYWQLFLFYSSYLYFFNLGLGDGIYLKLGGIDYEKIDFKSIGTQFKISIFSQCIIAIGVILYSSFFINDYGRQFVWYLIAMSLPIFNAFNILGYIFQAANKTKIYSIATTLGNIFFSVAAIVLLMFRVSAFEPFVILFLLNRIISLIYCIIEGKEIIFSPKDDIIVSIKKMFSNIKVGLVLTLSSVASLLILGFSRMMVDYKWGLISFGKFSFALSLTNYFLLFISQVSMVLFPELRRINRDRLTEFYNICRNFLSCLLGAVFLAYIPLKVILSMWLPQYRESLQYLIMLLPICTFDGKMQMLCNTYFKVLRKERALLKINIISLILGIILSLLSVFVFENFYCTIFSMVITIVFRSVISEKYLSRFTGVKVAKDFILESILCTVFVLSTLHFKPLISFIVYLIAYILCLALKKRVLIQTLCEVKKYIG